PKYAAVGDLDGDGSKDIAVCCAFNVASILLNNGDGTFQPPILIPAGGNENIAVADLDNDNDLDLITASYVHPNPGHACVLLNNGDATFLPPVYYPAARVPHWIVAADFDDDGDNDLALANRDTWDVSLFLNNGDATFEPATNYGVGAGPSALVTFDFDGDNDLDLATSNLNIDEVGVILNFGGTSSGPCCTIRGDFNHSGTLDVLDVTCFVDWLWVGGNAPGCAEEADVDGNDQVDALDLTYLVGYFWEGGAAPTACP
ncbi:MAG: VCBS repeat-containing protein, partial [Candidatus Zixiibacteriota bacterium]